MITRSVSAEPAGGSAVPATSRACGEDVEGSIRPQLDALRGRARKGSVSARRREPSRRAAVALVCHHGAVHRRAGRKRIVAALRGRLAAASSTLLIGVAMTAAL